MYGSLQTGCILLQIISAPLQSHCTGGHADKRNKPLQAACVRLERELLHLLDKPFVFKVCAVRHTAAGCGCTAYFPV